LQSEREAEGDGEGKSKVVGAGTAATAATTVAAHAREPARLPARLSEGAGASGSNVLQGWWYFQEPSGAVLFFPFPAKNICLRTPLLFWTERGILCP